MTFLRDTCIEFFKQEDTQRHIKDIIRPIVNIIYDEIYTYIFFVCIYSVFLLFMTLAILVFLIWIRHTLRALNQKVDMLLGESHRGGMTDMSELLGLVQNLLHMYPDLHL